VIHGLWVYGSDIVNIIKAHKMKTDLACH